MTNEAKLELIKSRRIKQFSENMQSYGYPKTLGLVIAVLYYENKPMNLDELAKNTGMSKTRMSQVLRELERIHLVEKIFIKGSRRHTYILERDMYEQFITLKSQKLREIIHRNEKVEERILNDLQDILNDENTSAEIREKANKFYKESLFAVQYFDWMTRLVHFYESKEVFQHVPIDINENK